MTRLVPLLAALLLTLSLDAHAKKAKDDDGIQLTGIEAFDNVFGRVQEIDRRLVSAEQLLSAGRRDLNAALGLKRGTPFADALGDLRDKADGKLAVAMNGKQPKLEATDAVPANVQAAVDAVNRLTAGIVGSVDALVGVPAEAEKLVKQSKRFPDRLKDEIAADPLTTLLKAPKVGKTLKGNAELTAALPGRSKAVVGRMNDMVTVVAKTFPARGAAEPPRR